jgi:putative transposase
MRFTLRGDGRLKRLLAEAELEKDALREVAKGKF